MSTRTIRVDLPDRSYPVIIGDHILPKLAEYVRQCCPAHSYAVISDSRVAGLYGERVVDSLSELGKARLFSFPEGERHKTRESWSSLTDTLLDAGLGRDSAVVALGGGVVGDLAGFVAATFLRGVPCVQVPTSLLAMVDSSVGGKTGVDTPAGKNLVGAFHQPAAVLCDVATLKTLDARHFHAGMAEALKHGAIEDAQYLGYLVQHCSAILKQEPAHMVEVVRRSVEIKAAIVREDEFEHGKRAVLNFGHTIGHALEAASAYSLLHGEAVAIGMLAEARIGVSIGVSQPEVVPTVEEAISAYELPTRTSIDVDHTFRHALGRDKKRRLGSVRLTLLEYPGSVAREGEGWTHAVDETRIFEILGAST